MNEREINEEFSRLTQELLDFFDKTQSWYASGQPNALYYLICGAIDALEKEGVSLGDVIYTITSNYKTDRYDMKAFWLLQGAADILLWGKLNPSVSEQICAVVKQTTFDNNDEQ